MTATKDVAVIAPTPRGRHKETTILSLACGGCDLGSKLTRPLGKAVPSLQQSQGNSSQIGSVSKKASGIFG